ncbi:DUF512 domain-containing protein [Pseudoramibacter sp.]|jgi:putative radical SAM enzyme (TIGR03279 family)|uniref:DUF512 domain-containing protein n=1 Tax=Pseudoramibacter sp. TaxID=2034862 RepID=UPI0025F251B4|nr:DUF512 domain-containing protein [Pseudoramibacter sp.]MCH4073163.1 DUF512 domain-containing protein [Pseudoramibacter sp.]MCH4106935.1 DUF512 domain-containing protein [Pseudoramibacter sp.]
MKYKIPGIMPDSVFDEMGVEPGDFLISIDGKPVIDELDIEFFQADTQLTVVVEKADGEVWELDIEKDPDEPLGVVERQSTQIRRCTNQCVFCFIDQMPEGMRDTLYVKDDDERMSFLYGNYITLTNLSPEEKERIVRYHIMPINISVHTTEPELREKMLHNRFAGNIMDELKFFSDHHIAMNAQIVLCPGWNDGEHLKKTLEDLASFYPEMRTVSVVPIGLTKFRKGLPAMQPVDQKEAAETIVIIENIQKKMLAAHQCHFAYPADEFFLKAGQDMPPANYYEGFHQLENGVGMIAAFKAEAKEAIDAFPAGTPAPKRCIGIVTAHLAAPMLREIGQAVTAKWPAVTFRIFDIENRFFGEAITVAGLMTGQDILTQKPENVQCDCYFVPENALKYQTHLLLDDITLEDLEQKWQHPVQAVPADGRAFVRCALDLPAEEDKEDEKPGYEPERG